MHLLERVADATPRGGERPTHAVRWVWTLPDWAWVATIVVTLAGSWIVALTSATAATGSRHLFYVPIVIAAARFGPVPAALIGVASTFLAGPLAVSGPLDVWASRAPFFVGIGALVGVLSQDVRSARDREAAVFAREVEVTAQRAMLIQSVSHDFHTPLTVIHGVATTLEARPSLLAPAARPLVGSLVRATKRLEDLIAVVLAAGDIPTVDGGAEPIDLRRFAATVAEPIPGCSDRLEVRCDPAASRIVTVPAVFELLLRCLLDNAAKFSPPSTPIEVVVSRDDGLVVVEVRDHGPGMTEEEIAQSFEAFRQHDTQTAHARGGLGIGLFSAKRLAARIAAELELESPADGGLIARVSIPQRREVDTQSA